MPEREPLYIQGAILSPDQRRFLSNGDGGPGIWDIRTGKALFRLDSIEERFVDVAFSPDGRRLFVNSNHSGSAVWNVMTGSVICKLKPQPGDLGEIGAIGYSSDGKQLVTIGRYGAIRTWDANAGKALRSGQDMNENTDDAVFSPDYSTIAYTGDSPTIKIRRLVHGAPVKRIASHKPYVILNGFSPNGRWLMTTSGDDVTIWDVRTGQQLHRFVRSEMLVQSSALSSDGKRLAVGYGKGTMVVWNVATGRRILVRKGHSKQINDIYFLSNGTRILTASKDGTAILWNAKSGSMVRRFPSQLRRKNAL